jgi:Neuraminidase (sialidase)
VHVVWEGGGNISYIRSIDGGNSWGSIVDLVAANHTGTQPTLNLAERGLLVSWFDRNFIDNITTIAIRKSTNGGTTWSSPSYVYTDNPNHFGGPVSAVKGDSIFLVYYSNRNDSTGILPLRAIHSYNYGATWSDEVTVGHPFVLMPQPIRMSYCSGTLLAAWAGTADSSRRYEVHIYGYRSTDAGRTWSDTIWISPNNQYDAQFPCENCNQVTGQLLVGYMDYRYAIYSFYGDIFASISSDGAISWPFETEASFHHSATFPQLDFVQDTLVAVWSDIQYNPSGFDEIVFNRSNDGGLTWLGEQRLTNTVDYSQLPSIGFDRGIISVVWRESIPDSGSEIFYKKFTPDSTDGINEPDISPPEAFSLSAYPNPFNSSITININSSESGILEIYDIGGKPVKAYSFEKGNQRIIWDGKTSQNQPLSSGTYFIGRKGDEKKTIKVVYVK